MSSSVSSLLLTISQMPMVQSQVASNEPDDADFDDIIDSFGS